MNPTLIALALFGCNDDGTACERLHTPVETFETRAECFAMLDDAAQSEAAMCAEYPSVYAQCLTHRQLAALGRGPVDLTKVNGGGFAATGY